MNPFLQLIVGVLMLYFGAEWFVAGASALALALSIPEILIGLTVVAYGTSAPEVVVGIEAASAGYGAVALANVIGSNIANVGLILGIAALVRPARVDQSLRRRELPVLLATTAWIPLLVLDGHVSRLEGAVLLLAAITYTAWMILAAHTASTAAAAREDAKATSEAAATAGADRPMSRSKAIVNVVLGLAVLLVGGNVFVEGAVSVARDLGLSERLVGLTIVAVGTSLPELVTSVIAARRGHSDLAIGNVIGSNIFNVLLCLGAASLATPLAVPLATLGLELVTLVLMTFIVAVFIRSERMITRAEGAVALSLYVVFIAISIAHG